MLRKEIMSCDVTVVIPTYNSSGTLRRALESVYQQSRLPREIIVVDDGSADWEQSQQIASSGPKGIELRFIRREKNQGPSAARNAGITTARSLFLAFLDADDIWFKEKLAIQYELMSERNLDFSMHRYCHDLTRSRQENPGNTRKANSVSALSSWTPLLRNDSTNSVMVRRQKMVLYDESLRRGEDFTLYMELLSRQGCRAAYIDLALAGGFKSTIGVAGLSADVKAMHSGRMVALERLIRENKISCAQYFFGVCTEMLKYPIRGALVSFRSGRRQFEASAKQASAQEKGVTRMEDNPRVTTWRP
jgi:glycosyltransferase involved in cell wall biosynthesis